MINIFKKSESTQNPHQLKRKLVSALSMLIVASILLTTTSYAWLVLSVAPEATGISTNVSANGALEIALLTTDTRNDLSAIRTTVGESLATRNPEANNTWGNLIDLSYADYGLNSILLLPSRLNITETADGYAAGPNLLDVPTYGYDGRIVQLDDSTMSATFTENEFSLVLGQQDFGVRAIGTTDTLSAQGSALAMAKSNIITYTNSAKTATNSVLSNNGDILFNIVLTHFVNSTGTFSDTELDALKNVMANLQTVLDYIDLSMRQGVVAVAASQISSKDAFTLVRDQVMDTSTTLSSLLSSIEGVEDIPEEFLTWITELERTQNELNAAKNASNALTGGVYTWDQLREVLDYIMNVNYVMINGTWFEDFDASSAGSLIGGTVSLTLAPGSGIFTDIASFIDDFSSVMTFAGTTVEIATAAAVDAAYLTALYAAVRDLEAADSSGEEAEAVALNTTYGYALDLAFRCNAPVAELLLQTSPEHRIYADMASGAVMGGGSYMEFTSADSSFTPARIVQLMDAIRVAFIDDQNTILGIAKLNTSNRTIIDGVVKSPLYLYDFGLSEEDGSILMGERRLLDNTLADLTQNVAKAITVIVWLDGDIVDNTMVSATESASLNGTLNLQFSTNANLIPADNTELRNLTADKTDLLALLTDCQETFTAGQGAYASVCWKNFVSAYNYANSVYNNPNANGNQVYTAALNLTVAFGSLAQASTETLAMQIEEIRAEVGSSEDIARFVVKNADGSYATAGHEEYTTEDYDGWEVAGTVYQIDYTNNLHDEGNGIYTQIYTDASWSALASALYNAEATAMNPMATDDQINASMTALDAAYNSLQRRVFYKPYDYNGRIYYEAICNATDADTYGKWYDSNFNRIVADLTILNLDAYAEPVNIGELVQDENIPWNIGHITPYISILSSYYPELSGEEVLGANWSIFDENYFQELMSERHRTTLSALIDVVTAEDLVVDITDAENLLERTDDVLASEANPVIAALNQDVTEKLAEKRADEEEISNYMTPSQQILLTTAISTAKAVTPTDEHPEADLAELRNAVAHAESVLANTEATRDQADEALQAINDALAALDLETITEYNTLTQTLPVTTERYDVVYAMEYPEVRLKAIGKTGHTSINAVVLTKNGVLFTVSKDIYIYTPAESGYIYGNDPDTRIETFNLNLTSAKTEVITAGLQYAAKTTEQDSWNNFDETGKPFYGATAKKFTWASEDMDVATVTPGANGTCTITALKAGTTRITVSIETEEGRVYTAYITVTVS